MNDKNLILDYNEKPKKKSQWFFLSFQHVFAMFSATVLVPLLTGLPISTALFSSGVGTLIYILCTKGRVPIYLGSSFAYISYIGAAAIKEGEKIVSYGPALTGLVAVGLIYLLVSIIIKFVGVNWLEKLLPPIVVGPMIMVIGLGLAGSAVANTGIVAGGDWRSMIISICTLLIIAFLSIKGKGFVKIIPFLCGIVGGYLIALCFNWIGDTRLIDFTDLVNVCKDPSKWFALPQFIFLGWKDAELGAGLSMAKVSFSAVLTVIPLAFATICEHIGDHEVLGKITGRNYIENPGLHRTLMGDGLATAFAGLIGGPANTSYGENTSVVGMTKIGSVWVTGGAAVIAICLSFFNIFTTFIATIPAAVMGGVCLILYGFIASNGLRVLIEDKTDMSQTRNLIIVSVMLVIGLGGAAIKITEVASLTGMALSMIFGVILNLILPKDMGSIKKKQPEVVEEAENKEE